MAAARLKGSLKLQVAIATLFALATCALGLYFYGSIGDLFERYAAARDVRAGIQGIRTTTGRLSGAAYHSFVSDPTFSPLIAEGQIHLLRLRDSFSRVRLQSQIDIATANWNAALADLRGLSANYPNDPVVLNDLGVVYLQLARDNPNYWFEALHAFESAAKLRPDAPEPHFNMVLVSRQLKLSDVAKAQLAAYFALEKDGPWREELLRPPETESHVFDLLNEALNHGNRDEAEKIIRRNVDLSRKIATRYALNPEESGGSASVAEFVAEYMERQVGDETLESMLKPLNGRDRQRVIAARQHVAEGASLYVTAQVALSLKAYDKAADELRGVDSTFDELWVNVNRADTEIRAGHLDVARSELDSAVTQARRMNLKWLAAMAEAPFGSYSRLNRSNQEMLNRVQDSVEFFQAILDDSDSTRPQYYLAVRLHSAGDLGGAFKVAMECLRQTDSDDSMRLSNVDWLVSTMLYEKGNADDAITLSAESVAQAEAARNPVILSGTSAALAWLYETSQHPEKADTYLDRAKKAVESLDDGSADRIGAELFMNLFAAEIEIDRGQLALAERVLKREMALYSTATHRSFNLSKCWWLLGRVYAESGRIDDAREAYRQAVESAEEDSEYLQTERLRMAFDDERRKLYDSAIDFEYRQNKTDDAWSYVQRYRAKLFLEFLAQFSPDIDAVHSKVINRDQVQTMIPADIQVVEYVMLDDRLLIWYATDKSFKTLSVPISRAALDQKVQDFLAGLRTQQPMDKEAAELYGLLISPLDDVLDSHRTLAIIPDLALHGLPFAALRCPGNGDYLIQRYPLIESPSLTSLLAPSASPKRDAMISFGSQNDNVSAGREIEELHSLYKDVKTFDGPSVTKTKFLDAMGHAPVFHYAGHSAHDAVDPLRSSILLDGNVYGPNSVTAVDIAEHRLQPNAVVVLSSCDSSVGNSKDGIGMRGLTSAFLIGGAGSVVGSLWPVESQSTSELMVAFHRAFAGERIPVAQALRKAQLAFIDSNPRLRQPYYWAGFVVTGNFSAIR